MRGHSLIIRADGTIERAEHDSAPDLDFLQQAVGGFIETVPYFETITINGITHPCVAFCNEEGKLENRPYNTIATQHWYHAMRRASNDYLVGSVIILYGDDEFMRSF